jgi:hypothetical protein
MKVTRLLVITLLCFSLPAFSQTDEGRSHRFSDRANHKSCAYEPHGQIERKYYAEGPWQDVTVAETEIPCDSAGNKCVLFYPTRLGANGFRHPIVAYGNGFEGKPTDVAYLLKHLASWGFVVVGTEDKQTIEGTTILDSVKFMVALNGDPASIFLDRLDVNQIGAVGYSQGAAGVISAMIKSGRLLKTVVAIELPAMTGCKGNCGEPDMRQLRHGSIFFIGDQIEAHYNNVPSEVMKLKGTLRGVSHNDMTGQPGCATAKADTGWPCIVGVYGYLGYPTAWLMDRLQGDPYTHAAFVQGKGEMFNEPGPRALRNWQYVASTIR